MLSHATLGRSLLFAGTVLAVAGPPAGSGMLDQNLGKKSNYMQNMNTGECSHSTFGDMDDMFNWVTGSSGFADTLWDMSSQKDEIIYCTKNNLCLWTDHDGVQQDDVVDLVRTMYDSHCCMSCGKIATNKQSKDMKDGTLYIDFRKENDACHESADNQACNQCYKMGQKLGCNEH